MHDDAKALLVIMDGLGDRGRTTPLSEAKTPNFDELAAKSAMGFLSSLGKGKLPGSDTSHLAILGYDPHEVYKGRGTFEALGAGMDLKAGDVAFRGNLCTVEEGGSDLIVRDRRAGRDDYRMAELYAALDGMEIEDCVVRVQHTVEHRSAVVLSGPGLSHEIGNVDPHEEDANVLTCEPDDASDAAQVKAARVLDAFTKKSYEILKDHEANQDRVAQGKKPGNIVLCRGAGFYDPPEPFEQKHGIRGVCVAGGALYKGVARFLGMTVLDVPGATGTAKTDLKSKAEVALAQRDEFDFVFVHIKGPDAFGHDGKFDEKREMIERIDAEFVPAVKDGVDIIVATGDHSTPVSAKHHSADPVPLLFYHEHARHDEAMRLTESECAKGGLGIVLGTELMGVVLDYLGKAAMFGE